MERKVITKIKKGYMSKPKKDEEGWWYMEEIREGIKQAFKELRKKENGKFFARMNFWCCQSCAWYEVGDKQDEGKIGNNVVFYHSQDNDDLDNRGRVHLSHEGDTKKIVEILEKHNLILRWDYSEGTRIEVVGIQQELEEGTRISNSFIEA